MSASEIVKALGGCWHGSYGTASCPAHDDREPSLSICAGDNGKICGSYSTLGAWIEKGWLPEPHIMPNGQKFWFGSEIADALGLSRQVFR